MTPNNSQHSIPEVCAKAIEYAKRGNEELVVCCGHLVMTRLIDAARAENRALTSSSLEKAKNKRLTTRKPLGNRPWLEAALNEHFGGASYASGAR